MTKAEADVEAQKIFRDAAKKEVAVYEQMRKNGWKPRGLDGEPPPEVKAIDDECRRKIKELAAQIDE